MTEAERTEYMNLINLWNCSEPMTAAQLARMDELEECVSGLPNGNAAHRHSESGNAKLCNSPEAARAQGEKGTDSK